MWTPEADWHVHQPCDLDAQVPCAPPPVAFGGLPPPVVGVQGLGCPEEEGWLPYLARVALPWVAGAVAVAVVVGQVRRRSTTFAQWRRRHGRDPLVRRWLRDNEPPPEWRGAPLEWAYLNVPAGIVTARPLEVL